MITFNKDISKKNTKSNPKNTPFTSTLMAATGILLFSFAGITEVEAAQTLYKTIKVQNQEIFYREAGAVSLENIKGSTSCQLHLSTPSKFSCC
tara:strand:+ start:4741 stop:5019 length:279 start_codon:yes stop_codon:yes gene_type:complete